MLRFQLLRFVEALKVALLSRRSREVLVFLFFVIISSIFWLVLTLNDSYDVELAFPLELTNVNEETVITSDLPEKLHVTVNAKGSTLLGYTFSRQLPPVVIDFAAHDKGGSFGHVNITHNEVTTQLQRLVDPLTRIVSIRPDTLEYFFNRGFKKRVPVVMRGKLQMAEKVYLAAVRLEPDSVTVWGEERFLDSLTSVSTVVTNISNLDKTTTRTVALQPIRGAKFDVKEVALTAEVDMYTELSLQVPIVGTNFPAGYSLITFPSKARVSFRVGAKDSKRYTVDDFVITTTYEELMTQGDSMLHLKLRSVPEGISQVRITPEAVQYLIEKNDEE